MKKIIAAISAAAMVFGAVAGLTACKKDTDDTHDHVWNDGEVTKSATCTAAGVKTYKCTVEGCTESYTEPVAKLNHVFTGAWIKVDGDNHARKCATCDTVDTATAAHNYTEDTQKRVDATCHSDGEKTLVCSDCSAEKTEAITVRPNHTFTGDWVKVDGTDHARQCANCDAVDTANPTAHNYSTTLGYDADGHWQVCEDCGYKTEATEHSLSDTVVTAPQFNVKGEVKHSCSCGYEETEHPYAAANYREQFTVSPDADYPWTYGLADYTWDPAENFTFTAATALNGDSTGWTAGTSEIKSDWINSENNVAIGYKISANVTKIKYDISYVGGGDDPGQYDLRIWRMAEDGTLVGSNVFIGKNPDGGEVKASGEIETNAGETIYLIFFHEGGWSQVANFNYVITNVTD